MNLNMQKKKNNNNKINKKIKDYEVLGKKTLLTLLLITSACPYDHKIHHSNATDENRKPSDSFSETVPEQQSKLETAIMLFTQTQYSRPTITAYIYNSHQVYSLPQIIH